MKIATAKPFTMFFTASTGEAIPKKRSCPAPRKYPIIEHVKTHIPTRMG
jgi:hypothetical protein